MASVTRVFSTLFRNGGLECARSMEQVSTPDVGEVLLPAHFLAVLEGARGGSKQVGTCIEGRSGKEEDWR